MSSVAQIRLIVGLGNPGAAYAATRHNAGFMVIDHLAESFRISVATQKFNAVFGKGRANGRELYLVKPMAFMNRSGPPVQQLMHYFKISTREMLVIHDDIDLVFGRLKIKEKGGHGGHNGVKSIMEAVGSGEFNRLRIGVGRPAAESDVTGHVLGRFSSEERMEMAKVIDRAEEAAITVFREGAVVGMNQFN